MPSDNFAQEVLDVDIFFWGKGVHQERGILAQELGKPQSARPAAFLWLEFGDASVGFEGQLKKPKL